MTVEQEWTIDQAAELVIEQFFSLLDGCDDDDTVRPALVFEAVRQAWAPAADVVLGELTAGEMRTQLSIARRAPACPEQETE